MATKPNARLSQPLYCKNNKKFYPMAALHAVLKARHGDRPAGHWVVMTTTIADVKVIAMAYAWSAKGVSYFVSTCGSTQPSPYKYIAKFEDDWGHAATKEIQRPMLAHFLFELLPLIDEKRVRETSKLSTFHGWPAHGEIALISSSISFGTGWANLI